jgi:hypothetical protein
VFALPEAQLDGSCGGERRKLQGGTWAYHTVQQAFGEMNIATNLVLAQENC